MADLWVGDLGFGIQFERIAAKDGSPDSTGMQLLAIGRGNRQARIAVHKMKKRERNLPLSKRNFLQKLLYKNYWARSSKTLVVSNLTSVIF